MTGFDYKRLAGTATRLLTQFGTPEPAIFKSRAKAVYDPSTGQSGYGFLGQEFDVELETVVVLIDYSQRDIDGSLVQVGDQRIFIPPKLPVTPKTGDVVSVPVYENGAIIGYDDYEVIQAKQEAPGGIVVIYEVQGRKD